MPEPRASRPSSPTSSAGTPTEADGDRSARMAAPPEGTVIGRYVTLGVVGRGGMGVVLAAFDPKLDRKVALKLLHAGEGGAGQARLQREAQALARLSHEHVIRVHDVGTFEDRVFVAMELVQGRTLGQWLAAAPRSVTEVLRAFVAAGEGLAAAHAAGLVHRDFKPSNVLMGDDGRVKVTDFGLARTHAEALASASLGSSDELRTLDSLSPDATLTRTGALVGTPAYMAPEQFEGRGLDPRADQFSFCVALYEALAGRRPFEGATLAAIATAIAAQRPSVPLPGSLPRALRRALLRGLRADPEQRHADMRALLRALDPGRAAGRRRTAWLVAGSVTLAAGGAGWVLRAPQAPAAEGYCAAGDERLAGVWDDATRLRAQQAFEATGLSYAADTWSRTRARMDAQASAWVEAQREACEHAAERPQAMVCLHRRFSELRRLGGLLAAADAALVERAPQALEALGSIEACTDEEADALATTRPTSMAHVEALAEVEVLQEAGRYDDAVVAAEAAVEAAHAATRTEQAEALLALGRALEAAGRHADAEQRFHEALAAAVAASHHDVTLEAALGLADMITKASEPRFDDAERWTEHAAAALDLRGDAPRLRARIESAQGRIDHARGSYEAALVHFERALELRTRELGPDHYLLASHHNNLGHTYGELERQAEAIAHEGQALALEREHYGPAHPRVGAALAALCSSYSNAGRLPEAMATGSEAVAILRATVGPTHPSLGTALINLGSAQARAGLSDEAEKSFLEALANSEAAYGKEHRRVGLALNNLGVHYELTGRLAEAERYHRRAATVFVATLGPAHPTTAMVQSNLASVLVKEGKLDEAEAMLRQTLATLEAKLGPDHPDVALPMSLLAQILMDRERVADALPLLERVHALWQPGHAPPDDIAAVQFALGSALWEAGEDRTRAVALVHGAHAHYEQRGAAREGETDETAAWLREHGPASDRPRD